MRGNCLLFAIRLWWETRKSGSYLLIRFSQFGWWPHFLWHPAHLESEKLEQFTPLHPNHHLLIPPPWYRGYVKRGADFPPVKK